MPLFLVGTRIVSLHMPSKDTRWKLLWKEQAVRHPHPPTLALVDLGYELGFERLAWRLHWCMIWDVVPRRTDEGSDRPYLIYNWFTATQEWFAGYKRYDPNRFDALRLWNIELSDALHDAGVNFWSRSLLNAYTLLLKVPDEVFPCTR